MRTYLMIGVAISAMIISQPAQAQSSLSCDQLHQQLTKANSTNKSSRSVARYNKAIKQQQKMRAKVTQDLQRYSCDGANNAACKTLSSTLRKMDTNLANLTKKRNSLQAASSGPSPAAIKAKIAANNCNKNVIKVSTKPASEKLASGVRIFGNASSKRKPKQNSTNTKIVALSAPKRTTGSYRTMCVRSCDGYYFPISSNTTSGSFARDEYACNLMCPGTETNLYYHNSRNQESEDMVSYRTGEPYKQKPFAFAYRTDFSGSDKSCSCNLTAFHREMSRREALLNGGDDKIAQSQNSVQSIIPVQKVDPGEDPETTSNILGGMNEDDIEIMANANQIGEYTDTTSKNIRKVGPVFIQDE